jgi:glycerate 2-kinase
VSRGKSEVLICFDSFKGSIGSELASKAAAKTLAAALPGLTFRVIPFADGGEGTVDALLATGWQRRDFPVSGADGSPLHAAIACRGKTAVIELAQVAGLPQSACNSEAALSGSTRGVGELILHAVDAGCTQITLAVGGSSTSDGGTGMLTALGARLMSGSDQVTPGAGGLLELTSADFSGMDPRISGVHFTIASDVDNPLLGPNGAAAIFGPQKGATAQDVEHIERALSALVRVTDSGDLAEVPGAGAAGGTAFGAMLALRARPVSGAEFVASATGLADRVRQAHAVLVGEGKLDHQTLQGKGPAFVAALAAKASVPSFAIAGQVTLSESELASLGIRRAFALTDLAQNIDDAIARPAHYIGLAAAGLIRSIRQTS